MKRILIICTLLFAITTQAQEAQWYTDFNKAQKVAKKSNKPILMYFTGSDWCAPCKMLKSDFWENPDFLDQAEDFVLLEVDVPFRQDIISEAQMKKNKELQRKFNKQKSFPTVVALKANGREIERISAYSMLRDTSGYFAFIDRVR